MRPIRICLLVLAAAFLAPAGASAGTGTHYEENDTAGNVTATLSFDKQSDFEYSNVRLKVVRGGATVLDAPITEPCDQCPVAPAGRGEDDSMRVVDLNGDGEPEVLIDFYTGGAHCCSIVLVYGYQATSGTYERDARNLLDAGYVLADINQDGAPELKSLDARFQDFTAYAASVFPLQIYQWDGDEIVDRTRSFRRQLKAHATKLLKRYRALRRDGDDVRAALAAYVAEKYLLGQGSAGYEVAVNAYHNGEVTRGYLKTLRKILKLRGYR